MGRTKRERLSLVVILGIVATVAAIAWAELPDREPAILFDGEYGKITVISADGSHMRRLGSGGFSAVWSPDGTKIAASGARLGASGARLALSDEGDGISTMDADGGHRRVLAIGTQPIWSPDGSRIAFTRDADTVIDFDSLWTMDADGRHQRLVAPADVAGWSPDGKWLAYASLDGVRVVGATGGPSRVLSTEPRATTAIRWSPDGRWVLVEALGDIFLIRSDGSALRTIEGRDGAWSPNGRRLAFRRSRPCFRGSLYLLDAEDMDERRLTSGDYDDEEPSWAPGGDRIAFTRRPGGFDGREGGEIYVASVDDGDLQRLTRNDHDDSSPQWRPARTRAAVPHVEVPPPPARPPAGPAEVEQPLPVLRASPPLKPFKPVQPAVVEARPPFLPRTIPLTNLFGCNDR